jgi:hypothetical protein
MFVPLDGPARLAAHPNYEKIRFDVDLEELEGDTLLIGHKWQVAFTAMKGERRPTSDQARIPYDDSLNGVSAGDCRGHDVLLQRASRLSAAHEPAVTNAR